MAIFARRVADALRDKVPGVGVAAGLALAVGWMAGGMGDPLARNPVLVAMLFGLVLGSFFECPQRLRPGLDFTKTHLLRLGVILLGFRITAALLADLGWLPITIAAAVLAITLLVVGLAAKRLFKLDANLALLIAVGAAVCGAAAILSVAAMSRSRAQSVGIAIALITVTGTLALLVFPVAFNAGWMPGLDERGFGMAVGASIFELAQVYGASYAVSEGALNTATLVKLSKVVMLIPLLLILAALRRYFVRDTTHARIPIPWFVLGFVAVLAFNSVYDLDPQLKRLILVGDQFLFLMVTVALGITTPVSKLREAGGPWRLAGIGMLALIVSTFSAYGLVWASAQARWVSGETAIRSVSPAQDDIGEDHRGRQIFIAVGCAKCHVPSLQGTHGPVVLYSDLLLHDMGPGLDDKIVQADASGAEWRTTPLIGLGLRQRYLHDGRAETLRDAILQHGGEAEIVRRRFFELDAADQDEVYRFLMLL